MSEKYLCDNVPINDKFDKNCVKIDDNNLNSDKHLLHIMDKEKQFFVCNGVYVYNRGSCVMNPDIQKLITNPQSNIGASAQPVVQPAQPIVQPEVQPPPVVIQPETPIVIQPAFTEMTGKYCGPFPGDDACKTDDTSDKCYPKSTLDECKASCGNDCSGISYDAGRKWCIKCDNLNDVISHGAWSTHKNDNYVKEEVKTFQCPAEFPHLKPWKNDPKHSVWCYKSEAGTGAACNIPEDGVLAEGQRRGFNGSFATCAVETKPFPSIGSLQ